MRNRTIRAFKRFLILGNHNGMLFVKNYNKERKMMRKLILSGFLILSSLLGAQAQKMPRVWANNAFTYGEEATYKIRYSLYLNVDVGEVDFSIDPKPQPIAGLQCMHIVATGRTYGFYDPFYKIRDRYESFFEATSALPIVFIRDVQEGGFKFGEYVIFNQLKSIAKSRKRTQRIPQFSQDMLSAIYFARTIDYTNAKTGDIFPLHAFLDDSTYKVGVKYIGHEKIKTDAGTFECLKLKPLLVSGHVFTNTESMTLWVTDDANHIPVRVESGISVGAIRAELATYSNLKNPMTSKLASK